MIEFIDEQVNESYLMWWMGCSGRAKLALAIVDGCSKHDVQMD